MFIRLLQGLLTGVALLPAAALAAGGAGGVSISPVRVDLGAQQHAAAITVSNAGGTEKLIQVEATHWSHAQGVDEYTPARELVVNPPLFRLPAGASQVVRVGLARQIKADPLTEKTFRIFFQELPVEAAAGDSQLRMLLRIGVPVFVKPLQPATADLRWQVEPADGGSLRLQVRNHGSLHERLSSLSLRDADDDALIATIDGFSYVLPGQAREWTVVPQAPLPQRLRLRAVSEAGAIHVELPQLAP